MMYRLLENMHGGVDVVLCPYIQHLWLKLWVTASCCISTHLCITGCDQISTYHQETTVTFQAHAVAGIKGNPWICALELKLESHQLVWEAA